jgi:hypothetical protein
MLLSSRSPNGAFASHSSTLIVLRVGVMAGGRRDWVWREDAMVRYSCRGKLVIDYLNAGMMCLGQCLAFLFHHEMAEIPAEVLGAHLYN